MPWGAQLRERQRMWIREEGTWGAQLTRDQHLTPLATLVGIALAAAAIAPLRMARRAEADAEARLARAAHDRRARDDCDDDAHTDQDQAAA